MPTLESVRWILLQNLVSSIQYAKRSPWLSAIDQPDEIRTFPGGEHLYASRIFKPANQTKPLPLVLRMHGGGFIMNNPAVDDHIGRTLADKTNCIVVALDYSKSPHHTFPAAYEDIVGMALTVINDSSLKIDPKKIFLCGSSAGGNLALASAQDKRLRSRLAGVLAISPLVDFVTPMDAKVARRPDASVPDFLTNTYQRMMHLYLNGSSVELTDVRVSPDHFKRREDLPKHIYLLSTEHDMLSKEAELMAEKLAGSTPKQQVEGGWQAGTVRWTLIAEQKHAFEAFPEKDATREAARLRAIESTEQNIVSWFQAAFAAA